ncbi:MAG TPA: glyoxylate/hydroxypyruvate reductase A [Aestuariivirga sp.]
MLAVITPTWDTQEWVAKLQKALPDIDVRGWPELGNVAEITYAACWKPPAGLLASLPNLKLMVSLGAGVDDMLRDSTLPKHIPLLRVVDADLTARMSEYILLHVLIHAREQRRLDTNQRLSKWDSFAAHTAKDFSVGVMGLGVLGQDSASKLSMMGFKVRGWSRSAKHITGIECFSGESGMNAFLGGTDILVCLLPATTDTEGMINRDLLSRLSRRGPFGAPVLINAGRGRVQNEADILAGLDDGTLYAATLDVFRQEPLPATSAFWHHPKVTVTPHAAADSDPAAICAYVAREIRLFNAGQPVSNVVDVTAGY